MLIPDWITDNLLWGGFLLVFVVGVGILWPMTDAEMRLKRRKLMPADLDRWQAIPVYSIQEAAFLWHGVERPRSGSQVAAWLTKSRRISTTFARLAKLARTGEDGTFRLESSPADLPADLERSHAEGEFLFSRGDLQRYAKRRHSIYGEGIPKFLNDPEPPKQLTDDSASAV